MPANKQLVKEGRKEGRKIQLNNIFYLLLNKTYKKDNFWFSRSFLAGTSWQTTAGCSDCTQTEIVPPHKKYALLFLHFKTLSHLWSKLMFLAVFLAALAAWLYGWQSLSGWHISATTGLIDMKSCAEIRGHQRMKPADLGDLLIFALAPSWDRHDCFLLKCLECHLDWFRHSWSPEDEPWTASAVVCVQW